MMKRTKRFGAVLLALLMVLSMGITAFAADTDTEDFEGIGGGTIVIHKYDYTGVALTSDPADGTEQNVNTTVVGEKEVDDGQDGTITEDVFLSELTVLPGIEFELVEVELRKDVDPEELDPENPEHYAPKPGGITSTLKTNSGGTLTWANLPEGIYRITELENHTTDDLNNVDPFLVRLPFTDPANRTQYLDTVHVYPKNTVTPPRIDKAPTATASDGNGKVVNSGSILGWKLTVDIPKDIAAAQRYVITDTPSEYFSYVTGSMKVYYKDDQGAEVELDEDDDYSLMTTDGKITVSLTADGRLTLGAAIVAEKIETEPTLYVEYSTKINITVEELEELIAEGGNTLKNTAQVDFTNEAGYVYEPNNDTEETDVYGFKIAKVDKNGAAIATGDAKFCIYTTLQKEGSVDQDSVVADSTGATEFTTGEDGCISVAGLAPGVYYIVETQAPEGYNLLTGYVTVAISADGSATASNGSTPRYDVVTGLIEFSITNLKGFTLPQTGGIGAILFTVIGLALIVMAGVFILISRKKKQRIY